MGADDTGLLAPAVTATLYLYPDTPQTRRYRMRLGFQATPGATRPGRLHIRGPGVHAVRRAPVGKDATLDLDVHVKPGTPAFLSVTAVPGQPAADGTPASGVLIDAIDPGASS